MTDTSIIVNLPQMIDLALGSPELGAVNFNVLHALLHVVIQRAKLTDCTVEFRGAESERVHALLSRAKEGPSLRLTEYTVSDGKSGRKSSLREKEIGVISPRKDSKQEPKDGSPFAIPQRAAGSTVVLVERASQFQLPKLTVAVSENRFTALENNVEKLNQQIKEIIEMPNNSSLMEAVRTQSADKGTPVVDMWQILHLNKRIDATEEGVKKLASMVEDVVREVGMLEPAGESPVPDEDKEQSKQEKPKDAKKENAEEAKRPSVRGSMFTDIANRLNALEEKLKEISSKERSKTSVKQAASSEKPALDAEELIEMNNELDTIRKTMKTLETDFLSLTKGFKGKKIVDLVKDIEELKDLSKKLSKEKEGEEEQGVSNSQIIELEAQILQLTQRLGNLDELLNTQVTTLQGNLFDIEKELGSLVERVNTVVAAEEENANTSVSEIYNRVLQLQEELDGVRKTMTGIIEEKEERQMAMDALVEQLQLLKTIKADREDLEDALADKADKQHMNRKVSHDQFDAACGDLNRGIEETMNRLHQQENVWQSALEELQNTIGSKIDKVEFDPLKDFVDKKIHILQQRLKALMAMKEEQEAAGVRSKVLRDVNCLSCDKDVIIHKQNKIPTMPSPPAVAGNLSMKPYITYELDAVRKQQRLIPKGRNLNLLEAALQEAKAKEKIPEQPFPPTTHLCNRYCGGSHTITTPQQRVAHIGHFLNQWGPQVTSLDEKIKAAKEGGQESPRVAPESEQKKLSRSSGTRQSRTSKASKLSKIVEVTEEEAGAEEKQEKPAEEQKEPEDTRRSKSVKLSKVSKLSHEEQAAEEKEKRSSRPSISRKSTKSMAEQSRLSSQRSSRQEGRASARKSISKRSQSRRSGVSRAEMSDSNIPHAELESIIGHAEKILADKSLVRLRQEEEPEQAAETISEPMSEPVTEPVSEPITSDEEMEYDAPSEPEESVE